MNSIAAWIEKNPALAARLQAIPKTALLGIAAAIIALIVVAFLWLQEAEYQTLFSNLEDRDGGAVVSVLNQRNIPYKFANNGATILVPADQVYTLRLEMAEQGLPRGGNIGFELLDEPKFGVSQFAEQVNYQRALEGELARSIESMHPVKAARVHLAIPRQSLFVREREAPTASVLLTIYPGRTLSDAQVSSIAWLVSSSVPKLNASAVSVVDQDGYLLSATSDKAGSDNSRRSFIREIEQNTAQRILTLLNPIVGTGNVRAQVSANVDFSEQEETSEQYKPNQTPGTAAIRSKQTSNSNDNALLPPSGIPGALTNEPPANATAPLVNQNQTAANQEDQTQQLAANQANQDNQPNNTADVINTNNQVQQRGAIRNDATVNYEVDRTIRHIKYDTGVIKRLSVAVVVNYIDKDGEPTPLESEEMENINQLVKQAMGFSGERGDTLSIVNSAFADQGPKYKIWEDPSYQGLAMQILKILAILLAIFIVWRKIIMPVVKSFTEIQAQKIKEQAHMEAVRERSRQDKVQEKVRMAELNRYEENLTTAKQLASSDPRAVVMVLRSWMDKQDGKSKK